MCYNCGCHNPDDDMGSPDNFTNQTFKSLATKWNKSVRQVKFDLYDALENNTVATNKDLKETFAKAVKAWGQSVEEALENTYLLLKEELKK